MQDLIDALNHDVTELPMNWERQGLTFDVFLKERFAAYEALVAACPASSSVNAQLPLIHEISEAY
ncbi:MAG: hypothetical protein NTV22_05880 [bacterium]|nr:hypothetical protein [bacterium]